MRSRLDVAWWLVLVAACTSPPRPPAIVHAPPQQQPAPAPEPAQAQPEPPPPACVAAPPRREGPVELTIVDVLGRPIAGAEVTAALDDDDRTERTERLVADAGGRVTVPAQARLAVAAPGFVALANFYIDPLAPPRVHLLPASTIAGQVRDAASRAPLAGVALVVGEHVARDSTRAVRTTTDADGRFRATGLAPGRYYVVAEDDRRRGHRGVAVGLGETVDGVEVAMHRLVRVEGRMLAANGKTCLSGYVTLHVGNAAAGGHGCTCSGEPDTVTAGVEPKTGAVRFLLAPDQTYGVETYCEGHLVGAHRPIVARRQDVRGLVWKMRRGLTVRGRVVDKDGKPLAGVDVEAKYDPDDPGSDEVEHAATSTDANGEFALSGLARGAPELVVTGHPEGGWYIGETEIELGSSDITGLEIVAAFDADEVDEDDESTRCEPPPPPLPELRGTVVDAGGAPVANAVVIRYRDERTSGALAELADWRGAAPVLTDELGVFRMPFDPEARECRLGSCRDALVAYRSGGGEAILWRPSLDAPAQLRVGPRATIAGTVKSKRGGPVTTFGTTLDQNSMWPPIEYQYDPAGAFELPGVLPGTYLLGLHTPIGDLGHRLTVEAGQQIRLELVPEPPRDD